LKVYGQCDAVKSLLGMLNPHFKRLKLEDFEEFRTFSSNPDAFIKTHIDTIVADLHDVKEHINSLLLDQKDINGRLNSLQPELKRKYGAVKKTYGPLKEKIQAEIDELHDDRNMLQDELAEVKNALSEAKQYEADAKNELASANKDYPKDIQTYSRLLKEKEVRFMLQGAWGEHKVSSRLAEHFGKKRDYHLINAFDIDLMGKGIQFKDHGLSESKFDHVLLCEKGLIVLETKAWKTVTETGRKNLLDQLAKAKRVAELVFPNLKKDQLTVLLVTTELDLPLPEESGVESVRLDALTTSIEARMNTFTADDVRILMNDFLPHLGEDHIGFVDKVGVKLGGLFSKAKKKVFGN